jgi:hypothetical protein
MKLKQILYKLLFPLIGFGALIWFVIRVIPKPSRATYPCMRAAAPIASTFVIYLVGIFSSLLFFKKAKQYLYESRYILFSVFLLVGVIFGISTYLPTSQKVYANYQSTLEDPNTPIGVGKGVYPGRVVWIHDTNAVNQNCTNTTGDYWSQDNNTNQQKVDSMVSKAIRMLTGKETDADAWDAIFRNYNQTHGRGNVGYTASEKIVIKLNLNTGCSGNTYTRSDFRTVDTSPQIVDAVLDQLITVAGAAQEDITVGDPGRTIDNLFWNKSHTKYPNVKYLGSGNGRTSIVRSTNPELMTSDGQMQNYLPICYVEAAYVINIPVFKQHHRAGISLSSKNYFGTLLPYLSTGDAFPVHYSLPCTQGNGTVDNGGYGKYRIFVDFIGHKDLGGKVVLYLFDALWSSTNYGDPPWKWRMAPFNNHYPASIFASQDPVAIESVGFDFLHTEFYNGNPSGNAFPQYSGVDDFLHQAADSLNWPSDIKYDPENDGTYLPRSMGVHEHWNNATDMKYTRNLGTGTGIELVKLQGSTSVDKSISFSKPATFYLEANYPNPFNPATTITYHLPQAAHIDLSIYNVQGICVQTLVHGYQAVGDYHVVWKGQVNGVTAASGVYFARLNAAGSQGVQSQVKRMLLLK